MRPVDIQEFLRFILTGVLATCGNLAATLAARTFMAFEWALLVGIAVGFSISFVIGKLFAFRSRAWSRAPGEAVRFTLVYLVGITLYWFVSVGVKSQLPPGLLSPRIGESVALLTGAALMTFTSYFGHRFFTYRRTLELRQ